MCIRDRVIGQGLDGTAMRSFSELPSQDRWNLAFYIGRFAFPDAGKGEQLWKSCLLYTSRCV